MSEHIHVDKVTQDLYVLRVDDTRVNYFEALWEIPERISYNAYLLTRGNHVVLFDGWKARYSDEFIETIKRVVDPRDITEVIVHHMEPDHSGSISKLASVNSKATFYGHPLAGKMLASFYKVTRFKPLSDGAVLDVGTPLRFIHTPWLHWPETAMSYLEEEEVLLTCDAFGSYGLMPLYDDSIDGKLLEKEIRRYFVTVIGHYTAFVPKAISKLNTLGVRPKIIAPGHGTIIRSHIDRVISIYSEIAEGKYKDKATIVYVSMYGNVENVITGVKENLEKHGLQVEAYGFTDEKRAKISDVLESLTDSKIAVIGGATYEADVQPLMKWIVDVIVEKLSYRKNLKFLILSPYAWSGVAGKKLAEILKSAGFTIVETVEWEGAAGAELFERLQNIIGRLAI
ncbi:hypothetical protein MA03_06820 [Infirmifilum uzonense]|uniref:Flavodoxin-like domain-containing protein n=1 Tax=Infirmifilum uzonense TaxID=1550241 RepID=A0A0F7FJ45_9CREN|nr:FprA family A-type flavoprotein [Infirmifilum uzonense]AKG39009.1 hypothetical protein MA03_06820 [Infirmifilum uzonense]